MTQSQLCFYKKKLNIVTLKFSEFEFILFINYFNKLFRKVSKLNNTFKTNFYNLKLYFSGYLALYNKNVIIIDNGALQLQLIIIVYFKVKNSLFLPVTFAIIT